MSLRVPQNATGIYDATSLITHLAGSTLTVCVCAHIVAPIGGTVIGITSYSSDLTGVPGYTGVTFKSTTGVSASKVEYPDGAKPTNLETDLFLITAGITEADALAGKWAHAACTIFQCNYEALNMGQLIINKGYLSEFVQRGQVLTTEVRGFNHALNQQIGKVTRPECDADLYDDRCKVDPVARGEIHTGSLTAVTSQTVFRDSSRTQTGDYFQNGKIRFDSGNNSGFTFEIDNWDATTKQFTLRTPTPYLPVVTDTYTAWRGCQKRFAEDCVAKFGNAENNRSFPHMMTVEQLTRLPVA